MFEQILKHRPKGATHWQAGYYYNSDECGIWSIWENGKWHGDFKFPDGVMTKLPEEKEPVMSEFKEFKVGDKVIWLVDDPWQWDVNAIHEIREHSHGQYKVYLGDEFVCWCGDQVFWQEFRHAKPEEIEAGKRLDDIKMEVSYGIKLNDLGVVAMGFDPGKDITHDLGDDSHIENHISPLCKSKGV